MSGNMTPSLLLRYLHKIGHFLGGESLHSLSKVSVLSSLLKITSANFAFITGLASALPQC